MEFVKLGNTGLDVSRICLGCMGFGDPVHWFHKWCLEEAESRPIIKKALDIGINFFDTANVYSLGSSEEILGRALKDFAKRDEIVIATKVNGKMHEGLYLAPALMFTKSWGHRDEQVVGNFLFYEQDISETIFGALGYVGYAWTPGNAKITWDIGVGYRYVSSVGTQDIEESGIFPDLNLGVGFVF